MNLTLHFEARGIIYVDSRTPTQLGDARTYVRIRAANTSGDRSQGAANNFDTSYKASSGSKTGITLERAYVTWGGFTFGNMSSEWAGLWPSGTFVGGAADFTGIHVPTGVADRLFISEVIHQANIDVDEKGTTAAAATAVVMTTAPFM